MLKKIEHENLILYLNGRIDSTNTENFESELEEIFTAFIKIPPKNFFNSNFD